ncbi:MAG: sodium-dependent bicarbonate transport family permease [Pseudomonadota bacterium]
MESALSLVLLTLNSPVLVFFALGAGLAALSRSVQMPPIFSRMLGVLLIFAIGVKGGASLGTDGIDGRVLEALLAGLALSLGITLLAFSALSRSGVVERGDAAGIAAHYGSISIVTFATMSMLLKGNGIAYDGWMVAVAVTMEVPAIATALILARFAAAPDSVAVAGGGSMTMGRITTGRITTGMGGPGFGDMLRALGDNKGIALLLAAFAIGILAGQFDASWDEKISLELFPAVLILFLLDQGMTVGRRLASLKRRFNAQLAAFAIAMPLLGAQLGLLLGLAAELGAGNTALLMALGASASYIAAPAATRIALPGARPELYLTLSLCVTLPFNLLIGLPLYLTLADWLAG